MSKLVCQNIQRNEKTIPIRRILPTSPEPKKNKTINKANNQNPRNQTKLKTTQNSTNKSISKTPPPHQWLKLTSNKKNININHQMEPASSSKKPLRKFHLKFKEKELGYFDLARAGRWFPARLDPRVPKYRPDVVEFFSGESDFKFDCCLLSWIFIRNLYYFH